MPLITSALAHLIIVVIIGVVAGIAFNRVGLGWWSRTIGSSSQSDVTSALVGIAGAFIGFHLAVVVGLLPTPLMLYLGAILGAIVVLWFWRGR